MNIRARSRVLVCARVYFGFGDHVTTVETCTSTMYYVLCTSYLVRGTSYKYQVYVLNMHVYLVRSYVHLVPTVYYVPRAMYSSNSKKLAAGACHLPSLPGPVPRTRYEVLGTTRYVHTS